jgi:cell division ATPase FtsA
MRAVCGIDLDKDRTFLSFAVLKKNVPLFVGEVVMNKGLGCGDVVQFLQDNIEILYKEIEAVEKKHVFQVVKLYLKLPPGMEKMNVAEEVVVLKRTKKINTGDINFIKKYLEDNTLDWDDHCIHHFPLDFGIEGKAFESLPLGLWTKRIRVKSLLVTVKDRLYTQVAGILNNYDIQFGGFVSSGVCDYSSVFSAGDKQGVKAVVSIGYDGAFLTVVDNGFIRSVENFPFGLRYIIDMIGKKFSLPGELAEEIVERYISFTSELGNADGIVSSGKEVSVKDGDVYINISIVSVNSLLKSYVQENVATIVARIDTACAGKVSLSFLGRLNRIEGFFDFLKTFVKHEIIFTPFASDISSSFGCARYGVLKFLENKVQPEISFMDRISLVCKEYF